MSVVNSFLMWPVRLLFGPIATFNLPVLISFPLSALFVYLLAGEFTKSRGSRFVAGFLFAFCSYHFSRTNGHIGLLTIQWLPFYAWRLFALLHKPNLVNCLLVAVGFALASLSDLYYLGYFVIPFSFIFVAWFGWFDRKKGFWNLGRLKWLVLSLIAGAIITAPFYSVFFRLDSSMKEAVLVRTNDTISYSANLLSFFLPFPDNPFIGNLTAPIYQTFQGIYLTEQAAYPGYVLLVCGLFATFLKSIRRNETAFWAFTAGLSFLLALGPTLKIGTWEIGLPLPYNIYTHLPFLNSFRAPSRISVMLALGLAILAALSLSQLQLYISQRSGFGGKMWHAIAAILIVVGLAENTNHSWYWTMTEVTTPEIYHTIAAEPGKFLVMELPLAPLSLPMYYQIEHQKPLVGGYLARSSNQMSLSFDQTPYLSIFNPAESSAVMDGSAAKLANPEIFAIDKGFKQVLQERNIHYVILRSYEGGNRFYRWMRPYLEAQLGAPTWIDTTTAEENPLVTWKVDMNPVIEQLKPGQLRIRLGEGWNAGLAKGEDGRLQRFMIQDSKLEIDAVNSGKSALSLRFTPVIRPQTLQVRLNGQVIGRVEGGKEWASFTASFQNLALKEGHNTLEFSSQEGCLIVNQYIPSSPDSRCISLAIQDVKIDLS
ncbi:hypothetical protein [Candidatus Chlorohelix sp.]|uniref:hypothetical protein n=1 Tax=Candidatus Chlorohelix sp. TaxID=3139201 RepID=UPI0030310136